MDGQDWHSEQIPARGKKEKGGGEASLPLRGAVVPRPITEEMSTARGDPKVSAWSFTDKTGTGTSAACKHPVFQRGGEGEEQTGPNK